ncbi:LamG domain-containing protein [Verrucomicrobiaceae bacterium 227]
MDRISPPTPSAFRSPTTISDILYLDNLSDWSLWSGDGTPEPTAWNKTKDTRNTPLTGEWSHLALTYDRKLRTKTLYLNGEVLATQENILLGRNLTTDLHIGTGSDPGTRFYYQGKLDDLAIFCEALSPTQISTIMNEGVASFVSLSQPLAITGFQIDGDQVSITSTSGLQSGLTYHLESSNTLENFQPVPDTSFTTNSPKPPSIRPTSPGLFLRIVEGPGPVE